MTDLKRIKKSTPLGRHILPSGKFYYELYEGKDGTFFSDPETVNSETKQELVEAINRAPQIKLSTPEHFARMQECQVNVHKMEQFKNQ